MIIIMIILTDLYDYRLLDTRNKRAFFFLLLIRFITVMFRAHAIAVRTAQLTCSSQRPLSLRSKLQWLRAAVGRLFCPSGTVSDRAVGSGSFQVT
jgi:hypothetical protein